MTDIVGPASALDAVFARPSDGRQWGAIDSWFKDCSSPTVDDGTDIEAAFLNGIIGLFRNLIRAPGLKQDGITPVTPPDRSDNMAVAAVLQLIQRGQSNWAIDKGTTDAMLATPAVALAEYLPGMRFLVLKNPTVGANATPAPTINLGLGNLTVTKGDASSLGIGDLKRGGIFEVELDGAGNARLVSLLTISDVLALMLANVPGIVSASTIGHTARAFSSSGTFVVPTGVSYVLVYAWGAGAGGGGMGNNAAGGGGGGGAGGYGWGFYPVTPGSNLTITIGAPGVGGAAGGNSGTAGGTTTISGFANGAVLTVSGGQPGSGFASGTGYGGGGGGASVSAMDGSTGSAGQNGIQVGAVYLGGAGGGVTGGGAPTFNAAGAGSAGNFPAGGGGGGSQNAAGGPGAGGKTLIIC